MEYLPEHFYNSNKKQLNLSDRNLRSLDSAIIASYGNCTEYLDLSHNRIKDLSFLYDFPHLKCLVMDDNRLREAHFERLNRPLPNINTLMLNKNELSDLKDTAAFLQRIFPNVEYLSLHGNAMCPDNLLLQPFCEFVPYAYNHYRTFLRKSLPNLKFLDHFSLDSLHFPVHSTAQINQEQQQLQQKRQEQQQREFLTSTSKDLWSKLKSFLTANSSQTNRHTANAAGTFSTIRQNCASSSYGTVYRGVDSEGNRFITNSDL